MAYPYFGYSQFQQPQNSIIWVQGIEGAKAYPVGAGNTVQLMDSDNQVMFIKSADQAGIPMLRIFDYQERKGSTEEMTSYITRKEFEEALAKLQKPAKKKKVEEDEDDE